MIEEEYIIFNPTLSVRDFVCIDRECSDESNGWLEEPYDMVGPFCLDELQNSGSITFAQCMVISKAKWKQEQHQLQQEAIKRQQKAQQEYHEEIRRFHQKNNKNNQKEYRKLLSLPLEGVLDSVQIKEAYRSICKQAHPDVGGEHKHFIRITQARDLLIEVFG